jgi:GTP-binding protein
VLVHLIDVQPLDGLEPGRAYRTIRDELEKYSQELAGKPELVALNKVELVGREEAHKAAEGLPGGAFLVSAVTGEGVAELLEAAWKIIAEMRVQSQAE